MNPSPTAPLFGALLTLALASACDRQPGSTSRATKTTPAQVSSAPGPMPASKPAVSPELRPAGLIAFERVTGGADAESPLPLVVALHGLGDDAQAFLSLFDGLEANARIVALQAPTPHGGGFSWFSYRIDDDDALAGEAIREPAARVARAIDELRTLRPTSGKPTVTGFSQGGMLSFAIAARHPSSIGLALPVGGLLPAPLFPSAGVADAPRVLALHGADDRIVAQTGADRAIAALVAQGFSAELTSFPGVAHQIPPAMRALLFRHLTEAAAK